MFNNKDNIDADKNNCIYQDLIIRLFMIISIFYITISVSNVQTKKK